MAFVDDDSFVMGYIGLKSGLYEYKMNTPSKKKSLTPIPPLFV